MGLQVVSAFTAISVQVLEPGPLVGMAHEARKSVLSFFVFVFSHGSLFSCTPPPTCIAPMARRVPPPPFSRRRPVDGSSGDGAQAALVPAGRVPRHAGREALPELLLQRRHLCPSRTASRKSHGRIRRPAPPSLPKKKRHPLGDVCSGEKHPPHRPVALDAAPK